MTTIRDRLEEIPAGTELLREVRHWTADTVVDVTTEELVNAARWLRAAAYSCTEGARRVDTLIAQRTRTQGAT